MTNRPKLCITVLQRKRFPGPESQFPAEKIMNGENPEAMCQCLNTDEPCIAILMAVYNPNPLWFRQQLESLNRQTYPNLRLYVRDDCSPQTPFAEIQAAVAQYITAFPAEVRRNEKNLGSNRTFELLTAEAQGDRFAYCDQDDVWLPEKLAVMEADMERTGAVMVCCDVSVIDGQGNQKADSITKVRKHAAHPAGTDLAPRLLFRNFVFGCACLMDAAQARASLPFCPYYFHDHYLALWSAAHGLLYSEPRALIRYRIHGSNQTGVMLGVKDKESYAACRIQIVIDRLTWLEQHFDCDDSLKQVIREGICWSKARLANWQTGKEKRTLWRYRHLELPISLFELAAAGMPNWMVMAFIRMLRKNVI